MDNMNGPLKTQALALLQDAHYACFNHPGRDILGMSHGPFSGVNRVIEIIGVLERENQRLKMKLSDQMGMPDQRQYHLDHRDHRDHR